MINGFTGKPISDVKIIFIRTISERTEFQQKKNSDINGIFMTDEIKQKFFCFIPEVRDIEDEILEGESLLFAPLIAPREERSVYLPPGNWRFWSDGRLFQGGQSYSLRCPLDGMLLFVKDGTLLPWAQVVEYITPEVSLAVTARVYGSMDGDVSCRLYDGDTEKTDPSPDAWLECHVRNGKTAELSRASQLYHCIGVQLFGDPEK